MRLQNLQKRQTNIRRIASELARKRMVAMMQHVASQNFAVVSIPAWLMNFPRSIGSDTTLQRRRSTTPCK